MLTVLSRIRQLLSFKATPVRLKAIFVTEQGGQPMQSLSAVNAIVDRGLEADRYCTDKGYWHRVEACQVTLISQHDLSIASRDKTLNFDNGSHRRNLVIEGLKTKRLQGKTFRIGDAIFKYDKPRPPCGYLNTVEGKGMALALSYNSGVCLRVVQGGKLSVGDELYIMN